jgi:hypothetical protein
VLFIGIRVVFVVFAAAAASAIDDDDDVRDFVE